MRYEKGRKASSRREIVAQATRRFRSKGLAAVGLTEIMNGAGLTNGAFYTHFDSRDHLVREALIDAFEAQAEAFAGADGRDADSALRDYLSPEHRDHPDLGCPSAALLAEIARQPEETRQIFEDSLKRLLDLIAERLPGKASRAKRTRAVAVYGTMLGCLQMARAVRDPELSEFILEAGVAGALALMK